MNRRIGVLSCIALAITGTSATLADTLLVPTQYPSIGDALNASANGDIIAIASGHYYERGLDTSNKIITITTQSGARDVTIDGYNHNGGIVIPSPIFYMDDSLTHQITPKTTLENLILQNGTGVLFEDTYVPPPGQNHNNQTTTSGGAVYVGPNSNVDIYNCMFMNNNASTGGAITFEGDQSETFFRPAHGTVEYCEFHHNTATIYNDSGLVNNQGSGGAVWSQLADPQFSNCIFTANTSHATEGLSGPGLGGGAIMLSNGYHWANDSSPFWEGPSILFPHITGCMLDGNHADARGGAIAITAIDPYIDNCHITNNYAYGSDTNGCGSSFEHQGGGGIFTWNSLASITGCTITGNSTNRSGGGVYSSGTIAGFIPSFMNTNITNNNAARNGGGFAVVSYPITGDPCSCIMHCTSTISNSNISNNVSHDKGGGIYFGRCARTNLTNTHITNNNSTNGSGGGVYMDAKSWAEFDHLILANNRTLSSNQSGGGMYLVGGQWDDSTPERDCHKGSGGTIATIKNSNISNNNSDYTGGGIFMVGNANCTMDSTTIKGNDAAFEGGGFHVQYSGQHPDRSAILVLTDCKVIHNSTTTESTTSDGNGGGLFIDVECEATITGGVVRDNNCQVPPGTTVPIPGAWTAHGTLTATEVKICGNSNDNDPNTPGACTGPHCQWSGGTAVSPTCLAYNCEPPPGGQPQGPPQDCGAPPVGDVHDVDGDGDVDRDDVRAVQDAAGICYHDTNGNGVTDIDDLLNVIEGWGMSCTP
ncbi:MAG: hypothetical protein VX527_07470 [Planctomycetota bacterium]|nr:hypothetical protein [Planctomycetota bacterium]